MNDLPAAPRNTGTAGLLVLFRPGLLPSSDFWPGRRERFRLPGREKAGPGREGGPEETIRTGQDQILRHGLYDGAYR